MIKVLLADKQSLVRAGFRRPLKSTDGITVVAEADDGAAVRRARDTGPDVVLMDVWMVGGPGWPSRFGRSVTAISTTPGWSRRSKDRVISTSKGTYPWISTLGKIRLFAVSSPTPTGSRTTPKVSSGCSPRTR